MPSPHQPSSPASRRRAFRAAVFVCLLSALVVPPLAAQSPFPARRGFVADGTGSIGADDADRLLRSYRTQIGQPYDLEGLAIVVEDCRPAPDPYFDGALMHYGLAPRAGEMVDDAVAWLICTDLGEVTFTYATRNAYRDYLDPAPVEGAMTERLPEDDIVAVLEEGIRIVSRDLAPAPEGRGGFAPIEPPVPVAQDELEPPSEEVSPASLWWMVAGAVILVLLVVWSRRRDRASIARRTTETATIERVRERMTALEGRLTRESPQLTRLLDAADDLGSDALAEIERRHMAIVDRLEELRRRVAAHASTATALETTEREVGTRPTVEALLTEVEALNAYVDQLEAEARHAERLAGRAEEEIGVAREEVAAESERYARSLASAGERAIRGLPTPETAFRVVEGVLERARSELAAARMLTAGRHAEDAADIARRIARGAAALILAEAAIVTAEEDREELRRFAPSCRRDVAGNLQEAEASMALAAALIRATLTAPVSELAPDPAASIARSLGRAIDEIERSRTLAQSIAERRDQLRAHATRAEEALRELQTAIGEMDLPRPDHGSVARPSDEGPTPSPSEARDGVHMALDAARSALMDADGGPDPEAAVWQLVQAETRLAERTDSATAARAAHERRRALSRGLAESTVQRAERYRAFHRDDIGERGHRRIEDARRAVRSAASFTGRSSATADAWTTAARIAAEALSIMLDDVERADERREPGIPRAEWAGPPRPVSGSRRRAPFPGRFDDWGRARDVGRPPRRARWGTSPALAATERPAGSDPA